MKNLKVKLRLFWAVLKADGCIIVENRNGKINFYVDTKATVAQETARYLDSLVSKVIEEKTLELDQDAAVLEANAIINQL